MPDRVKSLFVIFDIWALWRSALSVRESTRMSKNYKLRLNPVWHTILYSCTHMATLGVKGLTIHRRWWLLTLYIWHREGDRSSSVERNVKTELQVSVRTGVMSSSQTRQIKPIAVDYREWKSRDRLFLAGSDATFFQNGFEVHCDSLWPYTSLWNILNVVRLTEDWKEVVAWLVSV